jgi:hypothetical protein
VLGPEVAAALGLDGLPASTTAALAALLAARAPSVTLAPEPPSATAHPAPALPVEVVPQAAVPAVVAPEPTAPAWPNRAPVPAVPAHPHAGRQPHPLGPATVWDRIANVVRHGPTGTGEVLWSTDALVHRGVPLALCRATFDLDPRDDLRWVEALADSVGRFCRPLPSGSAVLVGPAADLIAGELGIPLVPYPEYPPYGGSVALQLPYPGGGLDWVEGVRGERWLNLVVGGGPHHDLLELAPPVVSWVGDDGLVAALQLCVTHSASLGYGTSGGRVLRAGPIDVALAVRAMIDRR